MEEQVKEQIKKWAKNLGYNICKHKWKISGQQG